MLVCRVMGCDYISDGLCLYQRRAVTVSAMGGDYISNGRWLYLSWAQGLVWLSGIGVTTQPQNPGFESQFVRCPRSDIKGGGGRVLLQ